MLLVRKDDKQKAFNYASGWGPRFGKNKLFKIYFD